MFEMHPTSSINFLNHMQLQIGGPFAGNGLLGILAIHV
jgi:hypothetical protein